MLTRIPTDRETVENLSFTQDEVGSVFIPIPAYYVMEKQRQKCRDMYAGVEALRRQGETYLPKKDMEKQEVYDKRLANATLYNMFKKAVDGLAGRVFSKELKVEGLSEESQKLFENIDMLGNNIDMFCKDVFETSIVEGMSFILSDMRIAEPMESKAEEKKLAQPLRPYWVHIKPYEVIGWSFTFENGYPELGHIRIRQVVDIRDGLYGVKQQERVRVYEKGVCKEFIREFGDVQGDVIFNQYKLSVDVIPIVPVFTNRTGLFTADPPLYDLAMLNIRWYQSNSSQDHILDYARFPVLFGKKIFQEEGSEAPFGPSSMIHSHNGDASLEYVEHTGASIEAGAKSLDKLEDRMAALSNEPLLAQKSGNETATRTAIDSASASSALQAWALQLKDALEQALVITHMWKETSDADVGELVMNTEFSLTVTTSDVAELSKLRTNGELSRETLWKELERRGLLGPGFDSTEEVMKLNMEGAFKDNGEGLLTTMADKQIIPKEILFNEMKRRGLLEDTLEWTDVLAMLQKESVSPLFSFGKTSVLGAMIDAGK